MSTFHTVDQGEYLAKIARHYGYVNSRTIWDAPQNKELKAKRKNPNVLFPGDRLFIPDKEIKEESRVTQKRHRFELPREKLKLRIRLMDLKKQPVQGHECTLIVEGEQKEDRTKADGIIEKDIADKAAKGLLLDRGKPGTEIRTQKEVLLKIGDLDPKRRYLVKSRA